MRKDSIAGDLLTHRGEVTTSATEAVSTATMNPVKDTSILTGKFYSELAFKMQG